MIADIHKDWTKIPNAPAWIARLSDLQIYIVWEATGGCTCECLGCSMCDGATLTTIRAYRIKPNEPEHEITRLFGPHNNLRGDQKLREAWFSWLAYGPAYVNALDGVYDALNGRRVSSQAGTVDRSARLA